MVLIVLAVPLAVSACVLIPHPRCYFLSPRLLLPYRWLTCHQGIHAESENVISLNATEFNQNRAGRSGGGVVLLDHNKFNATDITMIGNNAATMGGGLGLFNYSEVVFGGGVTLSNNSAHTGGGILLRSSALWSLLEDGWLCLRWNSADRGSALAFAALRVSQEGLHDIKMTENTASHAGTVYWIHDPSASSSSEPQGLYSPSIVWTNNSAPYGAMYATQATSIDVQPYTVQVFDSDLSPGWGYVACIVCVGTSAPSYVQHPPPHTLLASLLMIVVIMMMAMMMMMFRTLTSYHRCLPLPPSNPLSILTMQPPSCLVFTCRLRDFYGSLASSDNDSSVTASVSPEASQCGGYKGYASVSGATSVYVFAGLASFNGMRTSCYPDGVLKIILTSRILDAGYFDLQFLNSYDT